MLPTDLVMVAPTLCFDNTAMRVGVEVAPLADRTDSRSLSVEDGHASIERLLCEAVGTQSFQLWFRDRTAFVLHDDELLVQVGSPFVQTFLQRQFRTQITNVATTLLGPAARIRFEVNGTLSLQVTQVAVAQTSVLTVAQTAQERLSATTPRTTTDAGMMPSKTVRPTALVTKPTAMTAVRPVDVVVQTTAATSGRRFADLADFVAGTCNQLALTAAKQVCEAPGERLNPLYLFGGVGLGKTHLLEGLYCELRRRFPSFNVMFLTSEQFTNFFTHALRTHSLPSFRQRFRGVDVLLIDDVDFLDGKRVIQEEFLHTVKTLESLGKQVVVTADRHPRLLSQTSDELTSRFQSGLVCRLEAPDLETRTEIVRHKLKRRELELTSDAVTLVAQWFPKNVRELEGALNCLETHFVLGRVRLNGAMARNILADLQRDCVRIVRLADIERAVCDLFRLIPDELRSSSRVRNVAQPRMLAMFLARKLTQAAYSEIGEFFGGRNHSTVISAERQVQTWLTEDSEFTIASRKWTVGELVQTLEQQLLAS